MRATMGITWLLLSLSFHFQSICSEEGQAVNSVPKNGTTSDGGNPSGTKSTNDSSAIVTTTTDDAGKNNETIQTRISANTTAAVATTDGSLAVESKPTDPPVPNQTQAATTEKPATTLITITEPAPTSKQDSSTADDATQSQPQLPPVTSTSNSVVSDNPGTVQTSEASGSAKTSGTEATPNVQGNASNVKATMIPNTPTGSAPGQQSPAHTTTVSKTSQADSKGGIKSKTGTVTSPVQTAQSAPSPAGSPGTTSSPSILTNSGSLGTGPSGTSAGPPLTSPSGTSAGPPGTGPSGTSAGPPVTSLSDTNAGTKSLQTTSIPAKATTPTTPTASTTTTAKTAAPLQTFLFSLNDGQKNEKEKELVEVCKRLLDNFKYGNCSLTWTDNNGTKVFVDAEIKVKVKNDVVSQYYDDISKVKKPTDNKTLIAILASCGALLIMIVILAVCASHHRKPYNENQQHLTDELHTVENGYHDNPTLEVMEAQPEMQEKKMVLNGEFNDSWIVPMDNLLKEDMPDEEDTHL